MLYTFTDWKLLFGLDWNMYCFRSVSYLNAEVRRRFHSSVLAFVRRTHGLVRSLPFPVPARIGQHPCTPYWWYPDCNAHCFFCHSGRRCSGTCEVQSYCYQDHCHQRASWCHNSLLRQDWYSDHQQTHDRQSHCQDLL